MSTRARIGIIQPRGTVRSIYTHWGGAPTDHGPILLTHYASPSRVLDLLELGNLSVLGPEIGSRHGFDLHAVDDRFARWCLAYGRDRGDPQEVALVDDCVESFIETCRSCRADHAYLWSADRWIACVIPAAKVEPTWVPLAQLMASAARTPSRAGGAA